MLSNIQAEQLSKRRKKFLATTYKPFSRSLYCMNFTYYKEVVVIEILLVELELNY